MMRDSPPPTTPLRPDARGLKPSRSAPCALLLVLLLGACSSPPQSTRMTVGDFDAMAAEMAQSLAQNEALAERGADSEPWIVSIERVLNLSTDVMTQSEQWAVIARLRGSAPLQTLADDRNVRFVLPPERVAAMRLDEAYGEAFAADRPTPTHTMTATFRSLTRAFDQGRTDAYYCEFEILEHDTGEPVWSDRFEYKREAAGHIWD